MRNGEYKKSVDRGLKYTERALSYFILIYFLIFCKIVGFILS